MTGTPSTGPSRSGTPDATRGVLSAHIDIEASAATVYAVYADVESWPRWDPDLEAAGCDGPFAAGTRGWIRPSGAPPLRVRLLEVEPGRGFTAEAALPLARMRFDHEIRTGSDGPPAHVSVRHAVRFTGPLAALYRRLLGPRIARALPGAMAGLKRHVEACERTAGTVAGGAA